MSTEDLDDDGLVVPWWHFWNPHSGAIGGLITGALTAALIGLYIVAALEGWFL